MRLLVLFFLWTYAAYRIGVWRVSEITEHRGGRAK